MSDDREFAGHENLVARTAEPPVPPLTAEEAAAKQKLKSHRAKSPKARLRKTDDGATNVEVQHENEATGDDVFMSSLGAVEPDFRDHLMTHMLRLTSRQGSDRVEAANFVLAVVKGVEPRDQVEAMLATQMAAIHTAIVNATRVMNNAETVPEFEAAEKALNRLARTYAAQMETLKRYRAGGEQKITVQHVNVNHGGQAVVGDITRGGRDGG